MAGTRPSRVEQGVPVDSKVSELYVHVSDPSRCGKGTGGRRVNSELYDAVYLLALAKTQFRSLRWRVRAPDRLAVGTIVPVPGLLRHGMAGTIDRAAYNADSYPVVGA